MLTTKIYSNSVAKYDGGKLLGSEKIKRLTDAGFSDAIKMLCDYGYGGGIVGESSYNVDYLMSVEQSNLINFISDYSPDENLTEVLLLPYVINNIKTYYKKKFYDFNVSTALFKLKQDYSGVASGDYSSLTDAEADTLAVLDNLFIDMPAQPALIDSYLNKTLAEESLFYANKTGDKTVTDFVVSRIDLTNLLTFERSKKLMFDESKFVSILLSGGRLDTDELAAAYKSDTGKLAALVAGTPYERIAEILSESGAVPAEAESESLLYEISNRKLDNMLGLNPFINYCLAKAAEIKTVKMILVCLKNGVSDEIDKRLRCYYE